VVFGTNRGEIIDRPLPLEKQWSSNLRGPATQRENARAAQDATQ